VTPAAPIAPQTIESLLKADPLVGEAMVYGDRRPLPWRDLVNSSTPGVWPRHRSTKPTLTARGPPDGACV
jgi:hypothetical protein